MAVAGRTNRPRQTLRVTVPLTEKPGDTLAATSCFTDRRGRLRSVAQARKVIGKAKDLNKTSRRQQASGD